MIAIEQTILIAAPVSSVHARWLEFERLPEFMEGVDEVTRVDEIRLRWRGELMGRALEWESEVVVHIPERRIAWRTYAGFDSSGAVTFEPQGETATRVTLGFIFDPRGLAADEAALTAFIQARLGRDLQRFKELIEAATEG